MSLLLTRLIALFVIKWLKKIRLCVQKESNKINPYFIFTRVRSYQKLEYCFLILPAAAQSLISSHDSFQNVLRRLVDGGATYF